MAQRARFGHKRAGHSLQKSRKTLFPVQFVTNVTTCRRHAATPCNRRTESANKQHGFRPIIAFHAGGDCDFMTATPTWRLVQHERGFKWGRRVVADIAKYCK